MIAADVAAVWQTKALPSVPVEKITFVQLADAPYMKMALWRAEDGWICLVGQAA